MTKHNVKAHLQVKVSKMIDRDYRKAFPQKLQCLRLMLLMKDGTNLVSALCPLVEWRSNSKYISSLRATRGGDRDSVTYVKGPRFNLQFQPASCHHLNFLRSPIKATKTSRSSSTLYIVLQARPDSVFSSHQHTQKENLFVFFLQPLNEKALMK